MTDLAPLRSVIGRPGPRPAADDLAEIARADVTAIADLVGPLYVIGPSIGPLSTPAIAIAGPATTAKCPPGDNLAAIAAIDLARPGDVLVIDARGHLGACLGGARLLHYAVRVRGLAGFVVDGGFRDVAEARDAQLPIYARGCAPWSGPKGAHGEVNVVVACGGVVIHPGDVICASVEGIAVVPVRAIAAVALALRVRRSSATMGEPLSTSARAEADIGGFVAEMARRLSVFTGRNADDQ